MKSEQWKDAFKALPPGLTMMEIAGRIGCHKTAVLRWARTLGYDLGKGRQIALNLRRLKDPKSKRWNNISWSRSDSQIARLMGVSRQAVHSQRKRRNKAVDNKLAA